MIHGPTWGITNNGCRERELPEEKTLWEMLAERLRELNDAVGLR